MLQLKYTMILALVMYVVVTFLELPVLMSVVIYILKYSNSDSSDRYIYMYFGLIIFQFQARDFYLAR